MKYLTAIFHLESLKKLFLFTTAFLTLNLTYGQTNIYHPFPDSNAAWTWEACGGPPPMCGSHIFSLNGDTLVNSINYNKLYFNGQSLVGGIRNDSILKKTYFICFSSSFPTCISHAQEKILYDFNAGIGDTVFYGTCGYNWIVTSIDSIQLLDLTFRKMFTCNLGYVIEGIGTTGNPICGNQDGMVFLRLLCFQKNGTTYHTDPPNPFYNPNQNSCLTLGIPKSEEIAWHLSVYPNPFPLQTTLTTTSSLTNATLSVENCFGQIVAEIKNVNGKSITFSRNNLNNGLYFLRLQEGNKIIVLDKILITD
jgi:hypothetical protein